MCTREQTLRVDKEQVTFNVFKAIKHHSSTDSCFQIDVIDRAVKGTYETDLLVETLDVCIVRSETTKAENIMVAEMAQNLAALPFMAYKRNWKYEPFGEAPKKFEPSIESPPTLELKTFRKKSWLLTSPNQSDHP
ncbi:Uncharacterized protein Adt_45070 [Abeliophyllum distichum]|uniref:Uncharacterized protein n=1 Tax=Abeliophyllum distichum TaxID=126358 RepID=A0ABD1PCQ0_9LAMI